MTDQTINIVRIDGGKTGIRGVNKRSDPWAITLQVSGRRKDGWNGPLYRINFTLYSWQAADIIKEIKKAFQEKVDGAQKIMDKLEEA